MTIPESLPSLSAGAHDADVGEACVMEYVSLLAGEEWSDRPECTHPILAHEARTTNDLLLDRDRQRLVPLIGRLFGTDDDSDEIRARLRLRQARNVVALLEPDSRGSSLAAIERAKRWIGKEGNVDDAREAVIALAQAGSEIGELDPEHVAFHQQASRIFAFAWTAELGIAEAWALVALVQAHRIAASGECRADCGNSAARARRMVKELGGLIDEYDAATGRALTRSMSDTVRELTHAIG